MRAIWRPWVPKWGAQRDQTWSQWFILMYISIFYSFSTKDKQSGPLQKNQKKKTRFPDFYSTVIRKTAILQRKESSNQKIQEKEPLLTFKNTCKKVWAKRKYQFLALWPHSQPALLGRGQGMRGLERARRVLGSLSCSPSPPAPTSTSSSRSERRAPKKRSLTRC